MDERKKPRGGPGRITIADVAKACGVARSTVSNALTGKPWVKAETRRRIQQMANQLGYRASPLARALRTNRSFSVGVLLADISNPTFSRIVRGIEDVLNHQQCTLLLCNTDDDEEKGVDYLRGLMDRQVDGLILVSQHTEHAEVFRLLEHGPPFVLVHRRYHGCKYDYVGVDNAAGVEAAVAHLAALGHRRIGFVQGPASSTAAHERHQAFLAARRLHGLDDDPAIVVSGGYTIEAGREAAGKLLTLPKPPTAVLTSNDFAALGLIDAATSMKVRVPEELSVVGFDDIFVAALPQVALTTIRQPKRDIGTAAARLLLKRIEASRPWRPKEIIFKPELIVRGTTAAPKSGRARGFLTPGSRAS